MSGQLYVECIKQILFLSAVPTHTRTVSFQARAENILISPWPTYHLLPAQALASFLIHPR